MLEPWNNKNLLPPPVQTCHCDKKIDSRYLKQTCTKAINILSKQSPLHKESALLSRLLYKYDKKFRTDIGYRIFKKINTTLRRYLMLNIIRDIENFAAALPKEIDESLPTQQMLQYVLVRLVSLSKLMLRVSVCCKQAAVFYLHRIKRGESHWMSLMPYALLSRMWSLSNVLLQHSCSWYSQMYPFLENLQPKGLPFLPDGYELPENLGEWLDLKNHENFGRFQWSHKEIIKVDQILIEESENNTMDSLIMYVNEINKDVDQIETKVQPLSETKYEEPVYTRAKYVDIGEAISRENFKSSLEQPQKEVKTKESYCHALDRVRDIKTLREFLTKEETYRFEQNTMSLTNQLTFMQWQALKTALLTLCGDTLSNNRKIQRKFLQIWKKKCVDCS